MLVLELLGEAVAVVGIGVLLLLELRLRVGVLLLLLLLLRALWGEVARLLLLIGTTRVGGVVATVFAWGAHSCRRYGEKGYDKGGGGV